MMTRALLALFFSLSLVQVADAAPTSSSGAKSSSAAKKSSGVAAWPATVTLTAADGVATKARLGVPAKASRGVVLVHDARSSGLALDKLAESMLAEGWAVSVPDLRGHGASAFVDGRTLQMVDYQAGLGDVKAAIAGLRARGVKQVALMGVGFGATLALTAASEDPAVVSTIAVSPGLNLQGMPLEGVVGRYGARPVMFVHATGDRLATDAATKLHAVATGLKDDYVVAADRGTLAELARADMGFASRLGAFLRATWDSPLPPAPAPVAPRTVDVQVEEARAVGNAFGAEAPK